MNIGKILKAKLTNKSVLKENKRSTVVIPEPKENNYRSRFFKESWNEEEKKLYFK